MSWSATGLTLHTPEGQPYRFDPGALCLELLPTGGPGPLARYEVLDTPGGLLAWVAASRLAPGLRLRPVGERDLAAVRELRDALHGLTAARAHGRALAVADLAVVNAAAAAPPLVVRMTVAGRREWAPGASVAGLVSTIARDAIDLFTGPYADRVRECGAHDCTLLFVDTSRPGRRRWCAMERCGNRHKVRSHRARTGTGAGKPEREEEP